MYSTIYCFLTLLPFIESCYKISSIINYNELKDFHNWRLKYNKTYDSVQIGPFYNNWLNNRDYINSHNNNNFGYNLELNYFGDENITLRLEKKNHNKHIFTKGFVVPENTIEEPGLPPFVDWRENNMVTPVKNQQQCGSCWSFSAVGAMEGQHAKETNDLLSLSESQIVDCDAKDSGCDGGWMDNAFMYAIKNGMETESEYPYKPIDGTCNYTKSETKASFSSYKDVQGGESGLKAAVSKIGPISVAIDASRAGFQFYKEGIYYNPNCSQTLLDHGVLVVGYGTSNKTDYWIVKNSWGESWGNKGYIWMARNRNNSCGIATKPSYPLV